jgi:hypothetical protein
MWGFQLEKESRTAGFLQLKVRAFAVPKGCRWAAVSFRFLKETQ